MKTAIPSTAIGMNQYLAAVRSKRVLKSKSDAKIGIVVASGEIFDGRQPPGTIGGESTSDLLAPGALRQRREGGGAARRQPGRQRIRFRRNPARSAGIAQSRQAGGRIHEQLCGFGRLLHCRRSQPNIRQPDHADRIDRRVFLHPDVSAQPGEDRRQGRWHRHHAAGRRACGWIARSARLPSRSCRRRWIMPTRNSCGASPTAGRKPSKRWTRLRRAECGRASTRSASAWWIISAASRTRPMRRRKWPNWAQTYDVEYIEPELSLREQLMMQMRSRAAQLGQLAGLDSAAQRRRAATRSAARTGRVRSPGSTTRAGCMHTAGAASRKLTLKAQFNR